MSYTWITPKTDWTISSKFTYTDYNRIRNNLLFLNEKVNEFFPEKAQILDLGNAKTGYADNYYPSEFTAFEDALESFTRVGVDVNIGARNYYNENGSFIIADALNRLENCCIRWKDYIESSIFIPVEAITISPTSATMNIGDIKTFTVAVTPSNATNKNNWIVNAGEAFEVTKINNIAYRLKNVKGVADLYQEYINVSGSSGTYNIDVAMRSEEEGRIYHNVSINDPPVLVSNSSMTMLPNTGSYSLIYYNGIYYDMFQLIGIDIDGTNIATLLAFDVMAEASEIYGENIQDDRNLKWRTIFADYISANFSVDLQNSMLSVSKVVHTSRNTKANYSSKYHLIAANEIGLTDSHMMVLGNKTYPYLINNYFEIIHELWAYGYLATRSLWDKGTDYYLYNGIYWGMVQDTSNSNRLVYGETPTIGGSFTPLIFLNKSTHVTLEHTANGMNYYAIDWTGQSSLTLATIPLGSYVYDSRGKRTNEILATSIQVKPKVLTFKVGSVAEFTANVTPANHTNDWTYAVIPHDTLISNLHRDGDTVYFSIDGVTSHDEPYVEIYVYIDSVSNSTGVGVYENE